MEVKVLLSSAIFIAGFISTVNAIKCYQCNSYLDPGCSNLNLKLGGPQSEIYMKDCGPVGDVHATFCRKLDVTFLASTERRIVRSCGYILPSKPYVDYCFNADNEGYNEEICQCYGDICNAAPNNLKSFTALVVLLISFICLLR